MDHFQDNDHPFSQGVGVECHNFFSISGPFPHHVEQLFQLYLILEEHHSVRKDAGVFDVSHMTVIDFKGSDTRSFLQQLLANDVGKLTIPGKALYSCMLNEQGGIIDDLITYYMDEAWYRMVVNAATRVKDLDWIRQQSQSFTIEIEERSDLSMLAVQGPNAREKVHQVLGAKIETAHDLKPFFAAQCEDTFIARTGYTGEDGYEIIIPADSAPALWDQLLANGVKPIGLGRAILCDWKRV